MNWPKLVEELMAAGIKQSEIGMLCGVAQSTVSDLSRGKCKSPGYEIGAKLIDLHRRKVAGRKSRAATA